MAARLSSVFFSGSPRSASSLPQFDHHHRGLVLRQQRGQAGAAPAVVSPLTLAFTWR